MKGPEELPPGLAGLAAGRDVLDTTDAAWVLSRRPQTLRVWACSGTGPIRPVRRHGRLYWAVSDLAHYLAGAGSE